MPYPKTGFDAGIEWAKTTAKKRQLRDLENLRSGCRGSEWDWFFDSNAGSSAYSTSESLFFVFGVNHRGAAGDFWETIFGDDQTLPSDATCRGFAEGALSVWDEVKDPL